MDLKSLNEIFENNKEDFLKDYFDFLRFKSVSSEPEHKDDTLSCAEWLKDYVGSLGLESKFLETETYPCVYGEDLSAGKDAYTVLIYGHYDVQPVDPLELWESPPFEPTERNGKIYARGAQDNLSLIHISEPTRPY